MLEYLQETTFEYHKNIEEIRFDRTRASGDTKIPNSSSSFETESHQS